MKDRYERSSNGIRALAEGCRTVKNYQVSMNGRIYWGDCLKALEGQKVVVRVRDNFASVYSVYDTDHNSLGECHEPSKLEQRERPLGKDYEGG